jgi:hypothetical protein
MNVNDHDALKHAILERDTVLRRRLEARRTRSPLSLTTFNDLYAHMISGNDALDDSVRILVPDLYSDIFEFVILMCSFLFYTEGADGPS